MHGAAPTPGAAVILLVDDSELVRGFAKELLADAAYCVIEAESAAAALKIADRADRRIDMIVTDLMLPGMNGLELSKKMLALRPGLKVLLVSADPGNEIAVSLVPGARFLDKNALVDSLVERVRQMLAEGS